MNYPKLNNLTTRIKNPINLNHPFFREPNYPTISDFT